MKQIAIIALLALAAGCGGRKDAALEPAKPSRAASEGCAWATFESAALGVSLLYEKCVEQRFTLVEQGSAIVLQDASQAAPWPIVEVFTKREMQPIEGALREQFVSVLDELERLGCIVEASSRIRIDALRTLEIVPGGSYAAEIEKLREQGPVTACGDYGDHASLRFFVYQPEVTRTRFAFVDASRDRLWFDETSIRMLPDTLANAAVQDRPIDSLPLAERYAATIESRLDRLARKTGDLIEDQHTITWAAFRDGGKLVLIVEQQERGEDGSSSIRYFFRDGTLVLVRESSLGPAPAGRSRHTQSEILKVLAFRPDGQLAGGRKSVNSKAEVIEAAEEQAARQRAGLLLTRVQER
jgi:hypothetical protein